MIDLGQGKYYIYRHIRLDKNQPFYIGIGTVEKTKANSKLDSVRYNRAYSKKRNGLWGKIAAKTEYKVEILLESDDYEFIKQKEIEFIALYGRKDLNTGTLANLTDGGDGVLGQVVSQETKNKLRKANLGKKASLESRTKMSKSRKGLGLGIKKLKIGEIKSVRILQYDLEGNFIREWKSMTEPLGLKGEPSIQKTCKSKKGTSYGFQWRYWEENYPLKIEAYINPFKPKEIIQMDLEGNVIATYESLREAERNTGIFRSMIKKNIEGRYKHKNKGIFIWKYK